MDKVQELYSTEDLQQKLRAVANHLNADITGKDPIFVAVVGCSLLYFADLLRMVEQSVEYQFIEAVFPEDVYHLRESIQAASLHPSGRHIVLVRDVVSTGVIEHYLTTQFEQEGASSVLVVALVDIPSERTTEFTPDYSVLTIGRDGILVGYGLKHDGRHGNLPYLGQIFS